MVSNLPTLEIMNTQMRSVIACARDRDEDPIYLEGPYMITRSPAIHP